MEIVCKYGKPRVEISPELLSKMRNLYIAAKGRRIAIFGEVKKNGNNYKIVNFYVPKQRSSSIYTVIDQKELVDFGKKYSCVIRTCKKGDTNISSNNQTFFEATACDVDEYITIVCYGDEYIIDVNVGDFCFHNVDLSIGYVYSDQGFKEAESAVSAVSEWTYKDGYDPTTREEYCEPKLLAGHFSWRDVV